MLGQPISMLLPPVVGFRLTGRLPEGATATDLVLTVVQMLRKKGVVGKFVEFFGEGVGQLPLARSRHQSPTWLPEYGATIGFFPVDDATLAYLRLSNRPPELVALVEAYSKGAGAVPHRRHAGSDLLGHAGTRSLHRGARRSPVPKRPQDRINLPEVKQNFLTTLGGEPKKSPVTMNGQSGEIQDGSVVIAAITSCTNTSNPSVMIAAGLLAKKGRGEGSHGEAVGEDQPGAGLHGGDRILQGRRVAGAAGSTELPRGVATAAPPVSATAVRCPMPWPNR